jgi:hypothetical protein
MSEDTLGSMSSLCDERGLAFCTCCAHVKDVASHLSSITAARMLDECNMSSAAKQPQSSSAIIGESNHNDDNDPHAISTLLSCTLSSQELLLGLLCRCEVVNFRPGVDKVGIGLLVNEIVGSFASLLRVATGLSGEVPSSSNVGRGENPTRSISESASSASSFLPRLADAASLGLLSSSSKSALRSVLALFDNWSINMRTEADAVFESMSQLRNVLDTTNSTRRNDSTSSIRSGLPCHQSACTISQILLQSHEGGDGSEHPSPHGPEDCTFQIPHVILEFHFWHIENVLFPQICMEGSGGGNSEVMILAGTILDVCTEVTGILDLMLLADFHISVFLSRSSGSATGWMKLITY